MIHDVIKKAGVSRPFLRLCLMLQRTNLLCSSSLQREKRFC
jgi:hypothetical protein